MSIARKLLDLLSWKPAPTRKEELDLMDSALDSLQQRDEWKVYEKFMAMRIESAMNDAMNATTPAGIAEAIGRRNEGRDILNALDKIRKGKEFLESLNKEQSDA